MANTKKEQEIVDRVLYNYRIALNAKDQLHKKWAKFENYPAR